MQFSSGCGLDQQLVTIRSFDFLKRGSGGPQDSHRPGPVAVEEVADLEGQLPGLVTGSLQDHDAGQGCEGRIEHRPAEVYLTGVERFEAVGCRQLQRIVVGEVTLDDDFSR